MIIFAVLFRYYKSTISFIWSTIFSNDQFK